MRLTRMMNTIMMTVTTTAVTMNSAQPPQLPWLAVVPRGIPAVANPAWTTVFYNNAITNPNAVARDVAMVLRTSATESFFSSAISYLER